MNTQTITTYDVEQSSFWFGTGTKM